MTGDTDIEGLDSKSAREYVLEFITALKRTQKQRAILQEEQHLWERRVGLAEERDEPRLKRGAEARVAELKSKISTLLAEEDQLKRKVSILKEKLRNLKARIQPSVDVDELLAQLQMAVGPIDTLERRIEEEQASQALKELKEKMKDDREEA